MKRAIPRASTTRNTRTCPALHRLEQQGWVNWLPIHDWTEAQLWDLIRSKGLPYHYAYDLGMPRLSCVFCIFAPKEALLLAGYYTPALLAQYVAVEERIAHTFQHDKPLVQIQKALTAGLVPRKVDSRVWQQCA